MLRKARPSTGRQRGMEWCMPQSQVVAFMPKTCAHSLACTNQGASDDYLEFCTSLDERICAEHCERARPLVAPLSARARV